MSALEPAESQRVLTPQEVPFGVNEVRLNAWQWLAALALFLGAILSIPPLWEKLENFTPGPDYRIPYQLSNDYWFFGRRMRQAVSSERIVLLGDSVVWGEYVLADGTLSHFLNRESGEAGRFVNGGVNGLFPLALEGLVRDYARSLRRQKVLLHCNMLWLTSPRADLSTSKEEPFNHSRLVPQFSPRIPCYKADANERLSAIVEQHVPFVAFVNHLQNAYFEQKSILAWTLAPDSTQPSSYPNACKNPIRQITFEVPAEPRDDPLRGPASARHQPWSVENRDLKHFDWVNPEASLQWQAFQHLVRLLRERGNDVLVVLGPFNELLMAEDSRAGFVRLREAIKAWHAQNRVLLLVPETLPSGLYADASHPLTEGYALLAKHMYADKEFRAWSQSAIEGER